MPPPLGLPAPPTAPAIAPSTEAISQETTVSAEAMTFATEPENIDESADTIQIPEGFGSEQAAALLYVVTSRCEQWVALPPAHHANGSTVPLGPQPTAAGVAACIEMIEGEFSTTLKLRAVALLDACMRTLLAKHNPVEDGLKLLRLATGAMLRLLSTREQAVSEEGPVLTASMDALIRWVDFASRSSHLHLHSSSDERWAFLAELRSLPDSSAVLERLAATPWPGMLAVDFALSGGEGPLPQMLHDAAPIGAGETEQLRESRRGLVLLLHTLQTHLLLAHGSSPVLKAHGMYTAAVCELGAAVLDTGVDDLFCKLLLLPLLQRLPCLATGWRHKVLQLLQKLHAQISQSPSDLGDTCSTQVRVAVGSPVEYRVRLQVEDTPRTTRTLSIPDAERFTFLCDDSPEGSPM